MTLWLVFFALLVACKGEPTDSDESELSTADVDGDGFSEAEGDCNDDNDQTFPGATEACDGLDQDCDDVVDEDNGRLWYLDGDADGFGDPETFTESCTLELTNYVLESGDCQDKDPEINPEAEEICDGVDQNCDGEIDEGHLTQWYLDQDGDGYGDPSTLEEGCESPGEAYVSNDFDCDDTDPLANDLGLDDCDGRDNDCDGQVDESPEVLWYLDADGDGYGEEGDALASCTAIEGRVGLGTDCDDTSADIRPSAQEVCDGLDNDCDGVVDVDALDRLTWYADTDGDGHGVPDSVTLSCTQPTLTSEKDDDCDDADASVSPSADEYCDGIDNNCDGKVDEDTAIDASTYYSDVDGDGYGDVGNGKAACSQPSGFVADDTDCDDGRAESNPGASEVCDGRDNDCNGDVDDAAIDQLDWYLDSDGDGYGDSSNRSTSCTAPSGYVSASTDCDDADASISPAGLEVCGDGTDNDCDGSADEDDASDASTWYLDSDSDGYGASSSGSKTSCTEPSGYVSGDDDCDDADSAISPAASEVCDDGIDDDCDGTPDDGCSEDHCGNITGDETWKSGVDHTVTCDVSVYSGGSVTVEDGVTVSFDAGTKMTIGPSGKTGDLIIEGSTTGVTFTSSESAPAAGDWDGLYFSTGTGGDTEIEGLTVAYAGSSSGAIDITTVSLDLVDCTVTDSASHGVFVRNGAVLDMTGCTITDAAEDGVYIDADASIQTAGSSNFSSNTISGSGDYPLSVSADSVPELDSSNTLVGNGIDRVQVFGTNIDTDADWALLDVGYELESSLGVYGTGNPVLTIEDGVTLYFSEGTGLTVGTTTRAGGIELDGSTTGIVLTSANSSPVAGDWSGLTLGSYFDNSTSTLSGVEISYAGGNGTGALYVAGDVYADNLDISDSDANGVYVTSAGELILTDSTVQDSADSGLYVLGSLGAAGNFSGNTVTTSGDYGVEIYPYYASALNSDSAYTGNGDDLINLLSGRVYQDDTWQALDVPYQVSYDLKVTGVPAPELTLEDGVEIVVLRGVEFYVGIANSTNGGSLVVDGTSTGVSISSGESSPAAGDWVGLRIGNYGELDAEGLTLSEGGSDGEGCLILESGGEVQLDSSDISDCTGDGINGIDGGTLYLSNTTIDAASDYAVSAHTIASWSTNTLSGSGYSMLTYAGQLDELDTGSSFTGNTLDYIYVDGGTFANGANVPALDADYWVSSTVKMGNHAAGVTIEAGSTWYHEPGVWWDLDYTDFTFEGTASNPIILTSAQSSPAAGDWQGLKLDFNGNLEMNYTEVRYAGASLSGSVYCYYSTAVLDHVTIEDSSSFGFFDDSWCSATLTNMSYSNNASGDTN